MVKFDFICKIAKKDQLLRTRSSEGRLKSTRVDEEINCLMLLAKKTKARTLVRKGEEGPL